MNVRVHVDGGPVAAPLTGTVYPDTVYECAQGVVSAGCALSVNGGLSFGPNVPMYSLLTCGGLHGHLKAAPDGTVYVPNEDCGGQQGVAVSADNGVTWNVHTVPGSTTQDESVGRQGARFLERSRVGAGHEEHAASWPHSRQGVAHGGWIIARGRHPVKRVAHWRRLRRRAHGQNSQRAVDQRDEG